MKGSTNVLRVRRKPLLSVLTLIAVLLVSGTRMVHVPTIAGSYHVAAKAHCHSNPSPYSLLDESDAAVLPSAVQVSPVSVVLLIVPPPELRSHAYRKISKEHVRPPPLS